MKTDPFVKIMLVIIVFFLGIIALKPMFQTTIAYSNPGSQDYIKSLSPFVGGYEMVLFDTRNGNLWEYNIGRGGLQPKLIGKLVELGKPIQK